MIRRLALLLAVGGCGRADVCEEDPRALVQAPSATVTADGMSVRVEVADDDATRSHGLMHRRCDVGGLLLVAPAPGSPLPIWMCNVGMPLDLAFVRGGEVVHVVDAAPPCNDPCDACPIYGADVSVDAVLETPAGWFLLHAGDHIEISED